MNKNDHNMMNNKSFTLRQMFLKFQCFLIIFIFNSTFKIDLFVYLKKTNLTKINIKNNADKNNR